MTTWYPTVEWFEEFRDELNSNEEFQRLVADWGASFNGDFLFYIEDIPSDRYRLTDVPEELTLVEGLPDEVLEELPDDTHGMSVFEVYDHLDERDELDEVPDDIVEDLRKVRDIFDDNPTFDEFADTADEIRGCIPNEMGRLLDELREFVTEDHEVFAYMEFYDGECTGVDVLDSLDERDAGFVVRGSYWDWDHFIRGDENIIKVALQGYLEPEGDMAKLMQYSDALNEMGETRKRIDTKYIFDPEKKEKRE